MIIELKKIINLSMNIKNNSYNFKNKKIDIWGSPSVTHKTTNQTLSRLTSEFGWDPVRST